MSTHRALRMSWWNAAFVVVALIAAIVLAVQQNWGAATIMVLAAAGIAASAIYARSGRASDLVRLNAAEYVDERDRAIGAYAFAIVGVVALALSFAVFILAMLLSAPDEPLYWIALGQVLALTVAWMIANVIAVRRS